MRTPWPSAQFAARHTLRSRLSEKIARRVPSG